MFTVHNDWFYLGNSFTHTPTLERCFSTSTILMALVKVTERKLEIEILEKISYQSDKHVEESYCHWLDPYSK